jgi:phosphoglycolate phosphatase
VTAWRRLVLWDVDGTLLSARGAGRRALGRALERVYGTAGLIDGYDFRGKTDPRLVLDLMGAAGLADAAIRAGFDECFELYARGLAAEIGDGSGVKLLPGVAELVRRLHTTPGIMQGLLTGNIEEGARIKLEPTGLHPFFRTGAYGSDHADRRQLPSLAARRAEALVGHRFAPGDVLVIGDTPLDVECARAFGAVAVSVATGFHPREELAALRPDLLFDDFADVERAAALLG